MSLVVDASVLVAVATDAGPAGRWAEQLLAEGSLHAPQIVLVEATSVLRRLVIQHRLGVFEARQAIEDLLALPIDLAPFAPFARRAFELRDNLGVYDAAYVTLAEALELPLATLDARLALAPWTRCRFVLPEA